MAGDDGLAHADLEPPVRSSPRLNPAAATAFADNTPHSPPRKVRGIPSITPRKFNAFFARRSTRSTTINENTTRALGAITGSTINGRQRRLKDSPIPLKYPLGNVPRAEHQDAENDPENDTPRQAKRRKTGHHTPPDSSPLRAPPALHSSPCARDQDGAPHRLALLSPLQSSLAASSQEADDISDFECDHSDVDDDLEPTKRLVPLARRGMAAQLLQREMGDMPRGGRSFLSQPISDWRSETANFSSGPKDLHFTTSHEGAPRCIPFCVAPCNTNSLVAIGDEEGRIRLLDTAPGTKFKKIHLVFQTHHNAIIDLAFNEDDSRIATASGDQTGRVVDMMTQTPISVLGHHTASLKQVRFQPGKGQGSVLATSSRDGSIQVWDLRYHGGPVLDIGAPEERSFGIRFAPHQLNAGCAINSYPAAHEPMPRHQTRSVGLTTTNPLATDHADMPSRGEVPGRTSDVSVTAIQWLPAGREHLLLSACEADASIRLWDIRSLNSRHHRSPVPLGYTATPNSHTSWRHFGISSLSLSSDATRLYALCKDNTVYAYSTSHMIAGFAPGSSEPKRPKHGPTEQLPGPLYGFRHDTFHATSFYVKSAIRAPRDGRSEMLAVGSAGGSPVLFPTDETHFKQAMENGALNAPKPDATLTTSHLLRTRGPVAKRPAVSRTSSISGHVRASIKDDIPIIRAVDGISYGTPLVRGHTKEVGALAWSRDGSLVTVSDDFLVRCWREGDRGERARDLRVNGESGGRRWACGWADPGDGWDRDEEGSDWEEDE